MPNTENAVFLDIKPGWNCFATFGKQTIQNDMLGLCIFYKTDEMITQTVDKLSHVVVLKPQNKKLTYYFGAAWEQDNSCKKQFKPK